MLIACDPGKENMAITKMTRTGKILSCTMLRPTITDLTLSPEEYAGLINHIKSSLCIYGGRHRLVYERYIPRSMQRGNVAEISNVHIGLLLSCADWTHVLPITAASWKNEWNRKDRWRTNDSLPPHILDSIFMGYYYLRRYEYISEGELTVLLDKVGDTDYGWYQYKGEWYEGERDANHSRGRKNSFGT